MNTVPALRLSVNAGPPRPAHQRGPARTAAKRPPTRSYDYDPIDGTTGVLTSLLARGPRPDPAGPRRPGGPPEP